MPPRSLILPLVAMLLMLPGCSMFGPFVQPLGPEALQQTWLANNSLRVFDGRTGERLSAWQVFDRTKKADAVLFGELHDHPVGLPVASAIWADRLRLQTVGRKPALLLEFFERDHQLAIDDYLAGLTDEDAFKTATGRRATNYPDAHRDMLETTKTAGGVVFAANAPRRYVRLSRAEGYAPLRAMTPAQRATFVLPKDEQGPPAYRDRFVQAMGGMDANHGGSGPLDFLRSQLVWDATMADSVARALKAGHEPVALVVGRFHVEFDGATRQFLQHQRPNARVLSIVMVPTHSDTLADEDKGRGDIVVYVGPVERSDEAAEGS